MAVKKTNWGAKTQATQKAIKWQSTPNKKGYVHLAEYSDIWLKFWCVLYTGASYMPSTIVISIPMIIGINLYYHVQ